MGVDNLKETIETNYGIRINNIRKIKKIYKINSDEGDFCFKLLDYNINHVRFILGTMKHLYNNNFKNVPKVITTKNNEDCIKFHNENGYLTPWINGRQCTFNDNDDLALATATLAKLHVKSFNFQVTESMQPRIYWLKWIEIFQTRINEILDFKRRIEKKQNKTYFDTLYIKNIKEETNRAHKAIKDLKRSKYLNKMKSQMLKKGFCHHDYAYHNIIIDEKNNAHVIDFDYCILDTYLHDLSSLLIRKMKNGNWSLENAFFIIDIYNSINKIYTEDIPIMAAFIEFPQAYWQIGIQYYWEKQPWGEEFFVNKLNKIYKDRKERQEFVELFKYVKYEI